MYISKIVIENFRCFSNAEIEFSEGINVIIGHNNAGKTNLLKALGLIFDSNRATRLGVDDFSKSIKTVEYTEVDDTDELKRASPPSIKISVIITESTGDQQHNEQVPDDNNTVFDWRIKTESPYEAKLTYEFFLPEGEETKEYQEAVLRLRKAKRTSESDYWNLIQRKFIRKYVARIFVGDENLRRRAESDALNRFDFQFLDAIRDAERDLLTGRSTLLKGVLDYFLDDDIKSDRELGNEDKETKIEERCLSFENASATLVNKVKTRVNTKPILEYSRSVGASLGGEPDFEGKVTEGDLFSTLRLVIRDKQGHSLPASHNGLGYNNLIFISILLSKMQMSASNYVSQDDVKVFPMLLIEEPEAHLHPSMQFKLLKFLRRNLKDKKQVRQVFVTTHSTHITAAAELDEIICLSVDESNRLWIGYPGKVFDPNKDEDQMSKAYVKRFLDATKSDMLFAKRVIFVEGIAEQILMSCLTSYAGKSLEDKHVAIINVNGRYFNHFLRLFDFDEDDSLKKKAVNKKVACIVDADPTRKERSVGARRMKCYPYELDIDPSNYEYQSLSPVLEELRTLYSTHPNIRVCCRMDGKGKTLEYDLVFDNPNCKLLLTDCLSKREELEKLMDAYEGAKTVAQLIDISSAASVNDAVPVANWSEKDKRKALIASRYLQSVESSHGGGKGAHALELEYKLRKNVECGSPVNFRVPKHIEDAINHACA